MLLEVASEACATWQGCDLAPRVSQSALWQHEGRAQQFMGTNLGTLFEVLFIVALSCAALAVGPVRQPADMPQKNVLMELATCLQLAQPATTSALLHVRPLRSTASLFKTQHDCQQQAHSGCICRTLFAPALQAARVLSASQACALTLARCRRHPNS